MHILIIEDEEQLCRSVAEGLRIDGYETDICFDGRIPAIYVPWPRQSSERTEEQLETPCV